MKVLLDQGLPRSAAGLLRDAGVDSLHVGEIGMATASDFDILGRGQRDERVIVTLDADFHMLMALSGMVAPSVIRVRIEGLRAEPLAEILLHVLHAFEQDLRDGALVTVLADTVRLRRLPIH